MGLWSFVKDAGKAIGIGSAEASEATPDAEALKAEVQDLGLETGNLDIVVEGDTVKVKGTAASQEQKEKVILALGNVAGVAAVDDEIQPAGAGGEPVFHTVEKGDSLWAIAAKTMGNGAKYTEIFEANRPMLSDPDKIYPGQVLRIPQG